MSFVFSHDFVYILTFILLVGFPFALAIGPLRRSIPAEDKVFSFSRPLNDYIETVPLYERVLDLSKAELIIKRGIDVFGSVVGLSLSAPLFIILPILIKLDGRGPIFYTQERIGLNRRKSSGKDDQVNSKVVNLRSRDLLGRSFKLIKFRSMIQDAEKKCGPVWATENDARVTKIGRFLRKTRLDEIPQLLNVLKGDMSLVGPRPERPFFVREFSKKVQGYELRLRVKPGITGLAQVLNGYDYSLETVKEKVKIDIAYISNWSIWKDIKVLLKTVVVVLTTKGAI